MALQERVPGCSILQLEKENHVAAHQTGHNSGVIHAGVYYQPGSLKAKLCKEGAQATKDFCAANGIPVENCGKLIVATNEAEMERMVALEKRAIENGIDFDRVSQGEMRELEPAVTGLGARWRNRSVTGAGSLNSASRSQRSPRRPTM
jgi:L-2-hydroxyglutarate oxidase